MKTDMLFNTHIINLEEMRPFAEGGNRVCYQHPKQKDQCLKLVKEEKIRLEPRPWHKFLRSKASFNDNNRDYLGYQQKALQKPGADIWLHIARCHGFVATTKGLALATELITNGDKPAITLEDYLREHGLTDQVFRALKIFQAWLRKHSVLTKNLLPHNLVIKFQGDCILIKIIDGVGSQNHLATSFMPFLRHVYIERRIKYMWMRIYWEVNGRKGFWKKLDRNSIVQIRQYCTP